jgi:CO dehydrogenase/acetyl-CoA synthase alpha subunit
MALFAKLTAAIAGLCGVVGMAVVWGAIPTAAQTAGYQIQQKIDDQWQVFRTPKGNYAQAQSEVVCNLDLASAANAMPAGTILACRRAIRPPTPIQRAQGN